MAGADAQGALGTEGAMGRAELVTVSLAPHATPSLVKPKNAPLRRLRTEGPHTEISDFSPGSFPKPSTPIDLSGSHWA